MSCYNASHCLQPGGVGHKCVTNASVVATSPRLTNLMSTSCPEVNCELQSLFSPSVLIFLSPVALFSTAVFILDRRVVCLQ